MKKFLICFATELERKLIAPRLGRRRDAALEVCGFGLVAAAARTAWLIQEHDPGRAFLLGLAGTYSPDLPIGSAAQFQKVTSYGIGVGMGAAHRSAFDIGFPQSQALLSGSQRAPSDVLPLDFSPQHPSAELLLSVSSSAADPVEVDHRLEQVPTACAEDMEGFAFALACHQSGVPAQVIRGISNQAGERDRSQWRVDDAGSAAVELFCQVFDAVLV
jgi:futalosine hydrolase